QWKSIRVKGKRHFIWRYGVLYWGVTTAVLWSLLSYFFQPSDPVWLMPLIALVLFPLGGIPLGYYLWHSSEAKYKKITKISE
ncbi:MAG: hypothetical protein ACRDA8_05310, partial [Shewanella sp.]